MYQCTECGDMFWIYALYGESSSGMCFLVYCSFNKFQHSSNKIVKKKIFQTDTYTLITDWNYNYEIEREEKVIQVVQVFWPFNGCLVVWRDYAKAMQKLNRAIASLCVNVDICAVHVFGGGYFVVFWSKVLTFFLDKLLSLTNIHMKINACKHFWC